MNVLACWMPRAPSLRRGSCSYPPLSLFSAIRSMRCPRPPAPGAAYLPHPWGRTSCIHAVVSRRGGDLSLKFVRIAPPLTRSSLLPPGEGQDEGIKTIAAASLPVMNALACRIPRAPSLRRGSCSYYPPLPVPRQFAPCFALDRLLPARSTSPIHGVVPPASMQSSPCGRGDVLKGFVSTAKPLASSPPSPCGKQAQRCTSSSDAASSRRETNEKGTKIIRASRQRPAALHHPPEFVHDRPRTTENEKPCAIPP